jgi:uncharacterized protein
MKRSWAMAALLILAGLSAQGSAADPPRIQPLPLREVQVNDPFWAPKLRVYRERTIPHSWQYVDDAIRAVRKAAGENVACQCDCTWAEANLYKFLETAACSLAQFPDHALEKRVDEIVASLAKAQRPDGYLHAYVFLAGKKPWDPAFLDGSHDGYVLGHLIEAALEYQSATGKTAFLDIARKAADEAHRHFLGPHGQPGFCGHAELELALVKLYRATGQQRYLDLARAFIEWRGRHVVQPCSNTPRAYFQDSAPLRDQRTLDGHAVRAVFFASGVTDLAVETRDADYRLAANRFWDSTTLRRMAITGSVGPRAEHEAFGEDYELPTDGYYESCAACGLADFAERMFLLEGRPESADILERVLYNAVLHGISLDGKSSYYRNPLSDHDHARDNCWVCCPPNLSRTLMRIGHYAYAAAEHEAFVNLYLGSSCSMRLAGVPVRLNVETDYPWDGKVLIRVSPEKPAAFAVNLRIPAWCERAKLQLDGRAVEPIPRSPRGYVRIDRTWTPGQAIVLQLDMPVQRIQAHPNIRACQGKVAIQRGPIVYGFEGLDNPGSTTIELGNKTQFRIERRTDLLGGVAVIHCRSADGKPLQAIPFYALANRQKSSQEVWIAQRGVKPSSAWWEGRVYAPLRPDELQP